MSKLISGWGTAHATTQNGVITLLLGVKNQQGSAYQVFMRKHGMLLVLVIGPAVLLPCLLRIAARRSSSWQIVSTSASSPSRSHQLVALSQAGSRNCL